MDFSTILNIASTATNIIGSQKSDTKASSSSDNTNVLGNLLSGSDKTDESKGALDSLGLPTISSLLNDGKTDGADKEDSEKLFDGQKSVFSGIGKLVGGIVGTCFAGPVGSMVGNLIGGLAGDQLSSDADAIANLFD